MSSEEESSRPQTSEGEESRPLSNEGVGTEIMSDAEKPLSAQENASADEVQPSSQRQSVSQLIKSQSSSKQNIAAPEKVPSVPNVFSGSTKTSKEDLFQNNVSESKANLESASKSGSKENLLAKASSKVGSKVSSRVSLTETPPTDATPVSQRASISEKVLSKKNSVAEDITAPNQPVEVVAAPAAGPGFEIPLQQNYAFLNQFSSYTKPEAWLPEEADLALATSFLKANQSSKPGAGNLYNHLTSVVMRVLEARPPNSVDLLEMLSADVKRSKFEVEQKNSPSSFNRVKPTPKELSLAVSKMKLMQKPEVEDPEQEAEIPDIMELSKLWEWGGVSFGQDETFVLSLSIKKLALEKNLKSVRLWGKIFGLQSNYIIVEGELKEGVTDDDDVIANGEPPAEEEVVAEESKPEEHFDADNNPIVEIPLPKPKTKVVPALPKENRSGNNKYVYYTASHAGGEFTRLPDVIPEKLQISRKIRKFFSGNLNKFVNSYPAFNSNEAQLLRCQIARISAATVVSPTGYYTFDPDEEGDDSDHVATILINNEYEGATNENLLNTSNWVHHVPYILPQGRITWEDPFASLKNNEEGEEEDEEDNDNNDNNSNDGNGGSENTGPETGPTILSPINADEDHGDIPSWVSRFCSVFSQTKFSPVLLRNNRWPGASVISYNDKFASIYMGDGQKNLGNPQQNFIVPKLPEIQKEFGSGVEGGFGSQTDITEQVDPTLEEEKAFEDSQKVKEDDPDEEEAGEDDGEGENDGGDEGGDDGSDDN
ncbi:Radial spoke head protein 4 A [Clydaea vesicula]|uniref:Radial spoke head protein 4 A n=1 Tax=Clydaea vesicula TaxID=447962 RepID=A0AAD5U791_9FUNG|nr:Radial spoke head protein 4 A [Clydaea vesicula]KAJ3389973.1 Radial spoke head protein 4 A [Lobulomyces angularis]